MKKEKLTHCTGCTEPDHFDLPEGRTHQLNTIEHPDKTNTLDKCEECKEWFVHNECVKERMCSCECHKVKPEGVGEWVERIVIEYANLSGRESANRAEFRALVYKHLEDFEKECRLVKINEIEEMLKREKRTWDTQSVGYKAISSVELALKEM